jgi:DNA-binding transcriptional LysR family regulator
MRHLRFLRYVDEVARAGSIRRAADRLNVTASALNRRLMDIEAELDAKLFERQPRGVRLTSAGEIFLAYLREQLSDADRMRSQVEELRGLKRGTVRIACSQALAHEFLPVHVARFRTINPLVVFEVLVFDHERAMAALIAYEVDLVLVFRPSFAPKFQPLMAAPQRLVALLGANHPLAAKASLRLKDCANYPLAMADQQLGSRQIIEAAAARGNLRLNIAVQANSFEFLRGCVAHAGLISFQIAIGAMPEAMPPGVVLRPIEDAEAQGGDLVLGQVRGRRLPIASARFAQQIAQALGAMPARA